MTSHKDTKHDQNADPMADVEKIPREQAEQEIREAAKKAARASESEKKHGKAEIHEAAKKATEHDKKKH